MSTQVPFLLVIEGTNQRADQKFTDALDALTQQVMDVSRSVGWIPNRIFVGDLTDDEVQDAYGKADAVVIMGGEDVDPALYGMTAEYPESGSYLPLADARSSELIRESVANGKPLFGICRGLQLINVALGGTLVQHLETADSHRKAGVEEHEFVGHPVNVVSETTLQRILGATTITAESSHHQAVAELGQNLRVAATAPDGTIEAVEHTSVPILGVQWHPESIGSPTGQLEQLLRGLLGVLRERESPAVQVGGEQSVV